MGMGCDVLKLLTLGNVVVVLLVLGVDRWLLYWLWAAHRVQIPGQEFIADSACQMFTSNLIWQAYFLLALFVHWHQDFSRSACQCITVLCFDLCNLDNCRERGGVSASKQGGSGAGWVQLQLEFHPCSGRLAPRTTQPPQLILLSSLPCSVCCWHSQII